MKSKLFAAIIVIGTLTAFGQKPTTVPAPQAPAQTPSPAAAPAPATVKPEDIKALKDALTMFQLDQLAVQTAQQTVAQTDPVAKKAMEILQNATDAAPDVQKAKAQLEADRAALLGKIDKLRTEQKLDKSWDWDFNQNRFMQTPPRPTATPNK